MTHSEAVLTVSHRELAILTFGLGLVTFPEALAMTIDELLEMLCEDDTTEAALTELQSQTDSPNS